MKRTLRSRAAWVGVATVVAAAMLAPVGLADKPATTGKDKPVAAEKTWVKLGGGKGLGTYLKLDAGFTGALAGVTTTPLVPASDPNDNPDLGVRFPIVQGKLVLSKTTAQPPVVNGARGTIGHVGGLRLVKGSTVVRVRNLTVVANVAATDTSKLVAQVNGKRVDLATLKLGLPVIAGKSLTFNAVEARLTAAGATALNQALGTTLATDALVGVATVKARIVGQGKA